MIDKHQRNLALLVASCLFMENLDGTIVTTAAPRIAADLHVSSASIGLVITAYLITLAVLIPLSGWMVASLGSRKVFLAAIVIFTLASLLCAGSATFSELVVMRVLQGAGGAMMVPVGRLAVLARTAKADMMRMIAYIVWPALVAPVIAPLAGGLITTYASWRWLFLINVPLGVVALVVGTMVVPATPTGSAPRLDVGGVVLTGTGLAGLVYTAHLASEPGSGWMSITIFGLTSAALIAASIRHLLRVPSPLVDLYTLRTKSFRAFVGGGTLFGMTVGAVPFMLALVFQDVFRWTPVKSGSVVLFVFVGNIGIKPATTFLINRFGFRTVLVTATAGVAATVAAAGVVSAATPLAFIVVIVLLSGVARSVGFTAYTTLGFSEVTEAEMAHANGLSATTQQLAAALGVAVATVALRLGGPIGHLLSRHPGPALSYTVAFVVLALFALAAAAGATRLGPDAGSAVRRAQGRSAAGPAPRAP
ncbi:MAG: MFS transporter [Acidimicrobiales bacterium]|jgi:EmrB/QacA subfamily drug resistance transporter